MDALILLLLVVNRLLSLAELNKLTCLHSARLETVDKQIKAIGLKTDSDSLQEDRQQKKRQRQVKGDIFFKLTKQCLDDLNFVFCIIVTNVLCMIFCLDHLEFHWFQWLTVFIVSVCFCTVTHSSSLPIPVEES